MRQILFLCLFLTFQNASFAGIKVPGGDGTGAIYGIDDRELINENSPKSVQELARSVALIVSTDYIEGNFIRTTIKAKSLKDTLNMCVNENFATKSALPGCTGFLVGEGVMATAGHCFQTPEDCSTKKIIFDVDQKKQTRNGYGIFTANVYECKEILAQSFMGNEDYAIIRLDRVPKKRPILKLNTKQKIADDARVFMIGHPFGLPLTFSRSTKVNNNTDRDLFTAGLDSFEGNSGSPVFNAKTLEVEGILVNGQQDLVLDSKNECYRNQNYEESKGAEGVYRIQSLLPLL